jgi:hypothetical protein
VTHEGAAAALVYACVLVIAYNNVVFRGESLVHSNNGNMIDYRMTERTYGPGFHPASTWLDRNLTQTANLHDPGATWTQWETGGVFLRRSLLAGELPFWDPYTGGGTPAMANLVPTFFFPPYLVMVLLGNGALLKNLYFLGLLLTAAWCTWALLRRTGLSWLSSLVGGLAFLLSGALNQTVGSFIGQTVCCLPVGLLATRWFLEHATWTAAAWLALVFASIALASFPPVLLAVFGLSAMYACAEIAQDRSLGARRDLTAIRFGAAALLGVGLVAWYYAPAFSLMGATPQVAMYYRDASSHTVIYPSGLLQLLSPALFSGVPVWANDPIPRLTVGVLNYVGAATLLLVGLVGVQELRRPLWLTTAIALVGVLGLILAFPPFAQVRDLPLLRSIHFGVYYGFVVDFLLALLAAAGFERLITRGVGSLRAWLSAAALFAALMVLLFLALGLGIATHATYPAWRHQYLTLMFISFGAATLVVAASPQRGAAARFGLGCAIVVILAFEGIANCQFPRQKRWDAWDHPPEYVEFLQKNAGLSRVFTMGGALYANSGSAFGIIQLDSLMAFNAPRMYDLYQRYAKGTLPLFFRDASLLPPEPVLDAASVSYVTIMSDLKEALADVRSRGHQAVFNDGLVQIFHRTGAPRYFFTTEYEVLIKRRALQQVGAPRSPRSVILERQPSFDSRPNQTSDVPVKVERFSNNYVRLSVDAPSPGFVYASQSFFPGWHAVVNGTGVPIEPANYAFTAVAVPAGRVQLELKYLPQGFVSGLIVSAMALVVVGGLLGRAAIARRWSTRRPGGDEHLTGKERE